ncbi:MAG: bile acid:sodium symporter family protein [Succinivibrio sp.]|jgi:BASS family bile acid:Na+ symporter|nr:bile acid:sodium symporter family protein [Succinivibrio sp.]
MSNALRTLASVSAFFSKTFALWVIVFALISYYFPQGFLFLLPYVSILLGVVMFGMGLTLSPKDFSEVFHRPIQVIIGIVGQFILMPLIAFFLVKVFGLSADLAAGVLLVGCCPGGTSSNVMSYLGKGDVPLSVTITSCTTILAPLVTPGLFWLFAHQYIEVDPAAMFWSIVKIVLLPIIGGVVINALFGTVVKKVVIALPLISVFAIISIVTAVVAASAEKIAETALIIFLVVALHNCIGYLCGYLLGKVFGMKLAQKKTLAIEIGMQNSGLAAALAAKLAASGAINPIAAVPGAVFSVWHNISGPILATFFANLKDKDENEDSI